MSFIQNIIIYLRLFQAQIYFRGTKASNFVKTTLAFNLKCAFPVLICNPQLRTLSSLYPFDILSIQPNPIGIPVERFDPIGIRKNASNLSGPLWNSALKTCLPYRNFHPIFKTPSEFHGIFT